MSQTTRKIRVVAIAGAVALLTAIAAAPSYAGTLWVTDGSGNCNAFRAYLGSSFIAPSACPMSIQANAFIPQGENAYWMTTAPPGITINQAWTANGDVSASGTNSAIVVGDFWRDVNTGAWGGSTLAPGQQWFNTGLEGSANINSQIYGIQLVCTQNVLWGGCPYNTIPSFTVSGINLQGTETTAPSISGQGSLWTTGSYVWNPPVDPWSVGLLAADVSGVCASSASIGPRDQVNGPPEPRDTTVWQQCPDPVSWSFNVDTTSEVPTDGSLPIDLSATDAAGNEYTTSKNVAVDNDPVAVSFRTPNDANPSVWVNHAVTVDATPTAGPSGVARMTCAADGGNATSYTASGLTVNGDGVRSISCTAWNNAVGPQGQPNSGTASLSVHIDEAPPTLSFVPQRPGDPTALVVDAALRSRHHGPR